MSENTEYEWLYQYVQTHVIAYFLYDNDNLFNSKYENLVFVYKSAVIREGGGATCSETPFLSYDPPPSNYFCLIQMLCHRCYLGANFWLNACTFYYIGMVFSISVLSFYSDGYYFSFHVVDILQSFVLAIVTVVDPSSTPFFPLWISCT